MELIDLCVPRLAETLNGLIKFRKLLFDLEHGGLNLLRHWFHHSAHTKLFNVLGEMRRVSGYHRRVTRKTIKHLRWNPKVAVTLRASVAINGISTKASGKNVVDFCVVIQHAVKNRARRRERFYRLQIRRIANDVQPKTVALADVK